ncbi:MAG TPA: DUF3795 domain-containing protein [Nitrospirota bacterium]
MERINENIRTPDKRLAAVCGLFCSACNVFIGTKEDPQRLVIMAQRFQLPLEKLHCDGCRAEKRCFYCERKCVMSKCATAKGAEFCGECAEYPCKDLKAFQAEMPQSNAKKFSSQRIFYHLTVRSEDCNASTRAEIACLIR